MPFANPIVITIDGSAHSLNRIKFDGYASEYLKTWTNNELRCNIRHSYEGKAGPAQMERHNIDLVHTIWDPALGTSSNRQTYTVIRTPRGMDSTPANKATLGLMAFATANIAPLMSFES